MSNLLNRSGRFLKKNASTILTCVGGVGVVTTAVLAAKATPKALNLIEEAKREKGEDLTVVEAVRAAGPAYIPAVLTGVGTVACIFGANVLNKHTQASLISGYALLDSSFKEYQNKVEELYGESANIRVREEITKDKYDEEEMGSPEDGKQLFFDYHSLRYFESTIEDVQRAEYQINRTLVMRDYVYLNEFYELLDIPPIPSGYEYGWSKGGNLAYYWQDWIDFDHEKVVMEDGLECYIIKMQEEPIPDFLNYS